MRDRLSVVLDATSSIARQTASMDLTATQASPIEAPFSRMLPPSIDRGQAYYWSHTWQVGERESRDELAAGQKKTFANAQEAIRWLLSNDE